MSQKLASLGFGARVEHSGEGILGVLDGRGKLVKRPFPVINAQDKAACLAGETRTEGRLF
jgi:hypothetical protein